MVDETKHHGGHLGGHPSEDRADVVATVQLAVQYDGGTMYVERADQPGRYASIDYLDLLEAMVKTGR